MVLYLTKLWRRWAVHVVSPAKMPIVGYRALLDRLAEAGFVREIGETRQQFVERVGAACPSLKEATRLHQSAALGPLRGAPGARERARWLELLSNARAEVRTATPWYRRVLGTLHPVVFLDVR